MENIRVLLTSSNQGKKKELHIKRFCDVLQLTGVRRNNHKAENLNLKTVKMRTNSKHFTSVGQKANAKKRSKNNIANKFNIEDRKKEITGMKN